MADTMTHYTPCNKWKTGFPSQSSHIYQYTHWDVQFSIIIFWLNWWRENLPELLWSSISSSGTSSFITSTHSFNCFCYTYQLFCDISSLCLPMNILVTCSGIVKYSSCSFYKCQINSLECNLGHSVKYLC